jgi:hypothetical protein
MAAIVIDKPAMGRPVVYKPEYCELAYKFCLLGANNAKLAQLFEIGDSTFDLWLKKYPDLLGAVKRGRDMADATVAESLYHRAVGYEHPEDDIRTVSVGGGRSDIVITPTIKRYAPDTSAATLWLKNRQPHIWRDKVDVEHSGGLTLEKLPDEVLAEKVEEMFARMQAKR